MLRFPFNEQDVQRLFTMLENQKHRSVFWNLALSGYGRVRYWEILTSMQIKIEELKGDLNSIII